MGDTQVRTRRALLSAAAGTAAAIAANAALPAAVVRAADQPLLANVTNDVTADTIVNGSVVDALLTTTNAAAGGRGIDATGDARGVLGQAQATGGLGVLGSVSGIEGRAVQGVASFTGTGVLGVSGDILNTPPAANVTGTGVFGYADAGDHVTTFGAGVWGDSPDYGVYGSGSIGVYGDGGTAGYGVYAYSASGFGLWVHGKVKFATRSGKFSVAKGKTYYAKTGLAGVSSANIVIAVLQNTPSGTWIRSAVAGAGKITIYFNKALPSTAVVGWLVLG